VRVAATIRSANDEGVVFQTAEGVEAFRCSGVPEAFSFSRVPAGLSSTPTLSVLTRTTEPVTATVTLAYLANGFDWAANYVAHINPDGRTLDLGAWITLANGNGVSLSDASTQIVAGKLNREDAADLPEELSPRIIANCWPHGTTTDTPDRPDVPLATPYGFPRGDRFDGVDGEVIVTAQKRESRLQGVPLAAANAPAPPPPPPEQLGDLKLYRVPQPTTVAARQSKQVRLLVQPGVPFTRLCTADLPASGESGFRPTQILLRTKNTKADKLGLPLPSGEVAVFAIAHERDLLVGQAGLRDTAEDEDVELTMGSSPDVQLRQTPLRYAAGTPEITALTPALKLAVLRGKFIEEVEITSARADATPFELRLQVPDGLRVTATDQPMGMKDGRPIFRLTLPANGSLKVRYTVGR
jgi:hypothetical protein